MVILPRSDFLRTFSPQAPALSQLHVLYLFLNMSTILKLVCHVHICLSSYVLLPPLMIIEP